MMPPGPDGMMRRPPRGEGMMPMGGAPAAPKVSPRYAELLKQAQEQFAKGAVPQGTVWRLQLAHDVAWIRGNSFGGRGGIRQSPASELLKARYYAVVEPELRKDYEAGKLPLESYLAALGEQEVADAAVARLERRVERQGADSELAKAIAAFADYPKTAPTTEQLQALVDALRPQPRP